MGNSDSKQALPRPPPYSRHRNKGTQTDFPDMNWQLDSTSSRRISGVTVSSQQSSNNDATPPKTIANLKPSTSVGKARQDSADKAGSADSSSSGKNCKLESNRRSKRLTTGQKVAIGAGVAGVATLGAVGAVVAAPLVIAGVGFGAAGVTAGSLAAAWQSSIGAVAAGSFFASLQSAGAAGLAVGTQAAIGAAGAATGAGIGAGMGAAGASKFKSNKESKPEPKPKAEPETRQKSNTKSEPRNDSNYKFALDEIRRILQQIRDECTEDEGGATGAGVGADASKFKSNKESKPEPETRQESNTKSEPRDDSNYNFSLEEILCILEEIRAECKEEVGPRPGTWNVSQQVCEADIENATGCH